MIGPNNDRQPSSTSAEASRVSAPATILVTLNGLTGEALKAFFVAADFCNGRTPQQYTTAFANSVVHLAYEGDTLVGVARAVTDGVRCATIFDVCVLPGYRGRGIGTALMRS